MLDQRGKAGTAFLTASLLNEGTQSKTPEELEDAIGLLGASLNVSATRTSIVMHGQVIESNYDALMALATEMFLEPRWDASEFDRIKRGQLARLKEQEGNPDSVATLVFNRLLYGDSHVGGKPFGGTQASVSKISLADCQSWYSTNVSPSLATLHVAGAATLPRVRKSLERLERLWRAKQVVMSKLPGAPKQRPRLAFVDIPGSKQSVILAGQRSVRGDNPDFYLLRASLNRLGAGSSARLTQKLRIEKGYTYGAYA